LIWAPYGPHPHMGFTKLRSTPYNYLHKQPLHSILESKFKIKTIKVDKVAENWLSYHIKNGAKKEVKK
jgi:hypothetical protein